MSATTTQPTTLEFLQQQFNALQNTVNNLKEIVTGQQSEKYYTVAQVATKLGLTTAGVNYHIRKGNIKAIGGKQRYKKIIETELNNYIATISKQEAKG